MPPKPAPKWEYIETETGNKISRRAQIIGPKHIVLSGKCVVEKEVVIHGDLVRSSTSTSSSSSSHLQPGSAAAASKPASQASTNSIHLGRYVYASQGCTLHPPCRMSKSGTPSASGSGGGNDAGLTSTPTETLTYYPLRIGDHVFIGPNTHIRAAEIRSNVYIGANCVLGNMCMVRENVKILEGTVLPANSVWASGSVIAGRPARVVSELGDAWGGGGPGGGGGSAMGAEEALGVRNRERWAAIVRP